MKKFTLLFTSLIWVCMLANSQEIVVAGWTFPGNSAESDTGSMANLGNEIITMGGTSAIEFKNGLETKAAQASAWNDGMDLKCWVVELNTQGYENLTITSRQQSGGTDPGPKDFKLQYSLGSEVWVDVPGGAITVENDWTTSFVDDLPLPAECNDWETLWVRWIMTSNEASGAGGPVLEIGKSKIDDIYVKGEMISGIVDSRIPNVKVGPNPAFDLISIISDSEITEVSLIDIFGRIKTQVYPSASRVTINTKGLTKGVYIALVKNRGTENQHQQKILVR
jgi:hypothetical protein